MKAKNLKKSLACLTFCLAATCCWAQEKESLIQLNTDRLNTNKSSMWVLGAWAVANIATGAILRQRTEGSLSYFHEMNLYWNLVNAGIAGAALYGAYHTDPSSFDLWQTYNEQQKIEKILLFNCALNVSYMLGGAYLIERSRIGGSNELRFKGYGRSLIVQGGFLLLFDTTQYLIHHSRATPKLKEMLQGLSVNANGIGFMWEF